METNLIVEAVKFMILGMGIVYLFLTIMVYALKIQAKIINKFFPEKKVEPKKPQFSSSTQTAKIAAIVAAVQHHKNQKG